MIRWGVIGAGNMGRIFAQSIPEVNNAKLIAVSSLNYIKLESFANDFNIVKKFRFKNYEMLCKSSDVDAIYISTLNNTHFDLIKLCAINKKNILCEKPFCLNLKQAQELKKIIEENKVKFFEAIAYLSHAQTSKIFELINNDEIGEIKSIESSFGFRVKKIDPNSRLFSKSLGGGAILDIGCYPMSFISLFVQEGKKIEFKNIKGEICKTNVDITASADLLLNDKINCKINVSLKKNFKNNAIINGTKGSIIVNHPWLPNKKTFLEVVNENRYYKTFITSSMSVYANQIKNVSNEFLKKKNIQVNLYNISKDFKNMRYLDYWIKNIN